MSSDANVKLGSLTNGLVIPDGCVAKLNGLAGKIVLLPVYLPRDNLNVALKLRLLGGSALLNLNCVTALSAKIVGYVPFKITSYKFGSAVSSPAPPSLLFDRHQPEPAQPPESQPLDRVQRPVRLVRPHHEARPRLHPGPIPATSELLKLFVKVRLTG